MSNNINNQNSSAVYERLYQVYRNVADLDAPNQFIQLPQEVQNQVYGQVYELANRPATRDLWWGGNNAFRDLNRLQRAIQQVVFNAFRAMPTELKNAVAGRVYENSGRPATRDPRWGENHANDNVEILFRSVIEGTRNGTASPRSNHPSPTSSNIQQPNRFSDGDYADDNLLEDIIRSLSVEHMPVPSQVPSYSTSTTHTTTTQTTTSTTQSSTQLSSSSQSSSSQAGLNEEEFTLQNFHEMIRHMNNSGSQTSSPFSMSQTIMSSPQNSGFNPIESGYSYGDFAEDYDLELILRRLAHEEARTSPNTSNIDNSSNIEVVDEDLMTERKRMAIERLGIIASFGDSAIDLFEFINDVSAFDLDRILLPYARDIPANRLLNLAQWAEIGADKVQALTVDDMRTGRECVINAYRPNGPSSSQYDAARAQISQLISYFEKKREESGVNEQKLKVQCRGVIDKMIDASQNCVDQMNSQLQDMLLDIAVDAYVPADGDRRLVKMQCRAGQELTSHKVNILRQIILRQNQNEHHMADLEREILRRVAGSLGLNGEAFTTGAHFSFVVSNLNERARNAVGAYWDEGYRPLEFLTKEIALSSQQRSVMGEADPIIRKLRNELNEWAVELYGLLNEDPEEVTDTDMNAYLSKNFEAGSFSQNFDYGGEWSVAGTLFILEASGIIKQK